MIFLLLFLDYPFSPNVKISTDPGKILNQGESSFAVYKNNIYVLCNTAERSWYPAVCFARSEDKGETWEDYNFTDNTTGITWHTDPVVCVDTNGDVHIFVQFYLSYIKHYRSQDGGRTWVDTSFATDTTSKGSVDKPWFVIYEGKIYGVWQEFGGSSPGIRFAKSVDGGKSFKVKTIVPYMPGLCAIDTDEDGIIYVIACSGGNLIFLKSEDEGETWSNVKKIGNVYYTEGAGDRASVPSLTAWGKGNLYVVWTDIRYGTWDILGMYSKDGGETWSSIQVLGEPQEGGECKPWITTDPYGGLHLFYYKTKDYPTTTESKWSVRYRYSPSIDSAFHPSVRITDTIFPFYYYNDSTFMGDYHMIQADSYYVYAIWTDGRDGDMDLFFAKARIKEEGIEEVHPQHRFVSVEKNISSQEFYIYTFTSNVEFCVFDVSGKVVKKGVFRRKGKNILRIEKTGCYFIIFKKEKGIKKLKLLVIP